MLQPLDQQRRSAIQVLKARTKAAVAASIPSPAAPPVGKDAEHSSSEEERSAGFRVAAYGRAFHEAQSDFSVCSVAISVVLHGAAQHASVTTLPCEKQVIGIRWR